MTKKIEGLEEAIETFLDIHRDADGIIPEIENKIYKAATAYAKIQSGECVVVPREPSEEMRMAWNCAPENSESYFSPAGYKAMIQAGNISNNIEHHPTVEELLKSGSIKPCADGYTINPGHRVDATSLFELGIPVYTLGGGGGGNGGDENISRTYGGSAQAGEVKE